MAMKFRAHETFFIRKRWLSKGMKAVKNEPTAFISKEKKSDGYVRNWLKYG
mgnify:CR=1 FL=1